MLTPPHTDVDRSHILTVIVAAHVGLSMRDTAGHGGCLTSLAVSPVSLVSPVSFVSPVSPVSPVSLCGTWWDKAGHGGTLRDTVGYGGTWRATAGHGGTRRLHRACSHFGTSS